MKRLSPRLTDIRFKFNLLDDPDVRLLDTEAFQAFMAVVRHVAGTMVWTYSEPTDGGIDIHAEYMHRVAFTSNHKWKKILPKIMPLFVERDGKWYLAGDFIEVAGTIRPSMDPSLRVEILKRDGFTCGYCGSTQGPFDVDHVVPIARGGDAFSPENLMCSCATCNRSKGAKLVSEWIG